MAINRIGATDLQGKLVSQLSNRPTDPRSAGGDALTAKQMKERHDALGLLVKDKVNELIDALNNATIDGEPVTPLSDLITVVVDGVSKNLTAWVEDIAAKYDFPAGGIPLTDLSDELQTALQNFTDALLSSDVDATLSEQGKVADAKAVGDAIDTLIDALVDGVMRVAEADYAESATYAQQADFANQINTDREIEGADTACPPVVFGTVGGGAEVQNGLMPFPEVRGKTIKWNQLVKKTTTSSGTENGVTYTVNEETITVSTVETGATGYTFCDFNPAFNMIAGHKYLACGLPSGLSNSTCYVYLIGGGVSDVGNANKLTGNAIVTCIANTSTAKFRISVESGVILSSPKVFRLQVFDLTDDIYGAGNEPSTVAEFFRDFPLSYYAPNEGTLLSSKSSSVNFIKRNQCPALDTFFNVLPNTEYEVSGITAGGYLQEYDADKNLIKTSSEITSTTDITLTAQTVYAKIQATTYTDVLCYITWETRNLPYAAYSKQTITLPNIELRSAGSVYDVLYQTGGGQRKVGYVNLGDCNWEYDDDNQAFKCMSITLPAGVQNAAINILCSKYESTGVSVNFGSLSNKHCTVIATTQTFVIKDTDYSSASTFKTSLDGVYLCYELATPIEITTTENPGWDEFVDIDNFGTVKFNQDPAQSIPVPQAYFVRYTVNLVEFLDSLYVHCGGDVTKLALVE